MHPRDAEVAGLPELTAVGRCLVMGVVNITPDSFSDGGEWFEPDAGVQHGLDLLADGAEILDVGGESTRPGSARVSEAEELRRVIPVIERLAAHGAVVSVDTTRAPVAESAVAAGARIVNDVSGGLADPRMAHVVADTGVAYVAMHWRGHADVMDDLEVYDDVVTEVADELGARVDALIAAGADPRQVILDPGLGFSKAGALNWPLLAHLDALHALGRPVLVGASRKRFLGHLLSGAHGLPDDEPAPPLARDEATAAISALAAAAGAWGVRVHSARASADAVRVADAWTSAGVGGENLRVSSAGPSGTGGSTTVRTTVSTTTGGASAEGEGTS